MEAETLEAVKQASADTCEQFELHFLTRRLCGLPGKKDARESHMLQLQLQGSINKTIFYIRRNHGKSKTAK